MIYFAHLLICEILLADRLPHCHNNHQTLRIQHLHSIQESLKIKQSKLNCQGTLTEKSAKGHYCPHQSLNLNLQAELVHVAPQRAMSRCIEGIQNLLYHHCLEKDLVNFPNNTLQNVLSTGLIILLKIRTKE